MQVCTLVQIRYKGYIICKHVLRFSCIHKYINYIHFRLDKYIFAHINNINENRNVIKYCVCKTKEM